MSETKTAAIRQKEPPPKREAPYDWTAIARKLRRYPGKWYLIFENDRNSYAVAITQGKIAVLREGFEVRTANNKRTSPRTCDLYLRYNPEEN